MVAIIICILMAAIFLSVSFDSDLLDGGKDWSTIP